MDQPTDNSQSHSDLAGSHIGDYRLLRRLGSGGMADVYLAVQESLKRNVALKILKRHLAENEDYVDRFKREAQAAAGLVHATSFKFSKSVKLTDFISSLRNTFADET